MPKIFVFAMVALSASMATAADDWSLHTIDGSSEGADGVRLADVNRDGRMDIATGWEEGGKIRICLQPAAPSIRQPWPSVTVGSVKSPEDAVFADVNGDGLLDVVSCCEGSQKGVFFHINPGLEHIANSAKWTTEPVRNSLNASRWMFCEPLSDGNLILGSKEPNAQIALLNLDTKKIRKLRTCGWIMSLRGLDVDGDGDEDIVYSDRKGDHRSVGWLECPGENAADDWDDHLIGGEGQEVMFLDITGNAKTLRIACNTRNGHILDMTPPNDIRQPWVVTRISHPPNAGLGKAVAFADVNLDGHVDLVCTCGKSEQKFGVFWLQQQRPPAARTKSDSSPGWRFHDISGQDVGVKFDRIEMLDVDGDGDLDLLTCEERDDLGVIWYENPKVRSQVAQ